MSDKTASIYYLQNPKTGEIFYIGSTTLSLKERLKNHYRHLNEFERGLRKSNKRYEYLISIKPNKATINLLELVEPSKMDERESFYIAKFRAINPNLTNMTDGGRGKRTNKYYTESQMEELSAKLSKLAKGKKKPIGFAENMSKMRKGCANPAAKELKDWIVCFKEGKPFRLFKYGFEINDFIGNKHAYGNVYAAFKRNGTNAYNYQWYAFSSCSKEHQDFITQKALLA